MASIIFGNIGGGGSGGSENLFQVLTAGNDGGGLNIKNVSLLIDNAATDSVDVFNRNLLHTTGLVTVSWEYGQLADPNTSSAVANWFNRQLVSYQADVYGNVTLDWNNLQTFDNTSAGIISFDWGNRLLFDATALPSIDYANRLLYDNVGAQISVDWQGRVAYDNTGTVPSINWYARTLVNFNNNTSVDWTNLYLYNLYGGLSVDWGNFILYDDSGIDVSIDWNNRRLVGIFGGSPLQWNDTQIGIETGAYINQADNVAAPSTNIGAAFTHYYGSSITNVLGTPNDWMPIMVAGNSYKIPLYS